MPFEEYVKLTGWKRGVQGPSISVSKHGSFYLTLAAFQLLGEPDHVILGFDRERALLAIRAAGEEEPGARKLKRKEAGKGVTLMCRPFFVDQGIELGPETYRFVPELEGRWLAFGPVRLVQRASPDRVREIIATAIA